MVIVGKVERAASAYSTSWIDMRADEVLISAEEVDRAAGPRS
jgi:hypothetical protein